MTAKDPLTIADFREAWDKLVRSEEETKDMPAHPYGSFRFREDFCRACHRHYKEETWLKYSNLCYGKRRWWIGRLLCPRVPHFHVKCKICNAQWFESMNEKVKDAKL